MQVQATGELPLKSSNAGEVLREFVHFVRQRIAPAPGAQIRVASSESGARLGEMVARSFPAAPRGFGIGLGLMPGTAMMTGEEFLAAIAKSKPKKTYLQLYLKGATQFEAALGMLEKQATALTASGRGVMLFAHLTGWQIRDGDSGLRVDVTFSRFQKSGEQLNITVSVRFVAPSLRDPSVKTKLEQAGKILGLALGKPMSSMATEEGPPVSDPQLQPPTAEARMVVLATFYETLVRAARQVGTRTEDLRQIPLLFGKSAGFDKRMTDVQAGRKDTVNFPSRLKRFMSDRFPSYVFDAADPEQLWFRKSMGPTLDLLLMVDKVHQWGLGKTFTIEVAADFPNTAFGGAYAGWGGTRTNLFWMFHQGWEPQVWAYTTSQELDTALEGCGRILDRILPGLEEHAKRLLTPVPTELPPGVPRLGPISARDAYEHVLPLAKEWAADAQFESLACAASLSVRDQAGCGIDQQGRLRAHGHWLVQFVSERTQHHCLYTVPYTGSVWWNYFHLSKSVIPHMPGLLGADQWADSTRAAPRAFAEVQAHLGRNTVFDLFLALRNTNPYNAGRFVWEAHFMTVAAEPQERKDIILQFDPVTVDLLGATTR